MEENFDPKNKKILLVTAHADDADFCSGGTILRWIEGGAKASIVVATNGNKGTADESLTPEKLVEIRKAEQLAASKFLGLEHTWFLDYPDGELENTSELREKLVKIIREYRPDAVFTWDPTLLYSVDDNFINHADHRAIGQAIIESVFPLARDFLSFPEHKQAGLEPHKVTDLFLFNLKDGKYLVDISDLFEKKLELLSKHSSQLSTDSMKEELQRFDAKAGKELGVGYAEKFVHLKID